jgi:hypothetical protein
MKYPSPLSSLFVGLTLLVGCAYTGGDIADPIHRKFHWRSFVQGDDIAESCAVGSPDRARLVYNAVWGEQVRVYEWDSVRKSLRVRVLGSGDLTDISLGDPLGAWRAAETTVGLDGAAYDGLDAALSASGAFALSSKSLDLPSQSYYWSAATCHQGKFALTGWLYPSAAFDAARFPAALFALDPGRASVHPAKDVPIDVMAENDRRRGAIRDFAITAKAAP